MAGAACDRVGEELFRRELRGEPPASVRLIPHLRTWRRWRRCCARSLARNGVDRGTERARLNASGIIGGSAVWMTAVRGIASKQVWYVRRGRFASGRQGSRGEEVSLSRRAQLKGTPEEGRSTHAFGQPAECVKSGGRVAGEQRFRRPCGRWTNLVRLACGGSVRRSIRQDADRANRGSFR
jgi:hypothetical protein